MNLLLMTQHTDFWQELHNALTRRCSPRTRNGVMCLRTEGNSTTVPVTRNFFAGNCYFKILHKTSFLLKNLILKHMPMVFLDQAGKCQRTSHASVSTPTCPTTTSHPPQPRPLAVRPRRDPQAPAFTSQPRPAERIGLQKLEPLLSTPQDQTKFWLPQQLLKEAREHNQETQKSKTPQGKILTSKRQDTEISQQINCFPLVSTPPPTTTTTDCLEAEKGVPCGLWGRRRKPPGARCTTVCSSPSLLMAVLFCEVAVSTDSESTEPLLLKAIQGPVPEELRSRRVHQPEDTSPCFVCVFL